MSRPDRDPARVLFIWLGAVLLVAASIGLAFREEYVHQAAAQQQAEAQTEVLAGSVSAALAFDDEAAMRQYLSALMRSPQVAAAGIYGSQGTGRRLARRNARAPARLAGDGTRRRHCAVVRPVAEQGQRRERSTCRSRQRAPKSSPVTPRW